MKTFQLILIIIFIAGAVFGILVFSGAIPLGTDITKPTGSVTMWGTARSTVMLPLFEDFNNVHTDFTVNYIEKPRDTFDQDLLEALASGTGPDMVLLSEDLVFHYANKIFPIPYENYPLATFKDTFAGAGEVFLTSKGILAFPMTIDPLIMYYNRSILDSNSVIYPPKTWDELSNVVPLLAKKDNANKLIGPAVALGHFSNVAHAKDILVAMFIQAGNPVVFSKDDVLHSALSATGGKYELGDVLQFYTDFANPAKNVYSWNKSFPNSTNAFTSEDLAFYFGYASEFQSLVNRNPNQNFGVAPLPQLGDGASKLTNSRVTGIAILPSSKNFTTAFTATSLMATTDFAQKFAFALGIPPARRDLLSQKPTDAYSPVFYDSALFAKSWLDPEPESTDDIFRNMIEQVISNNSTAREAVSDASSKLELLLLK